MLAHGYLLGALTHQLKVRSFPHLLLLRVETVVHSRESGVGSFNTQSAEAVDSRGSLSLTMPIPDSRRRASQFFLKFSELQRMIRGTNMWSIN